MIEKTSPDTYLLSGPGYVADIQLKSSYSPPVMPLTPDMGGNNGKETRLNYGMGDQAKSTLIWSWGTNNCLPNEREQLIAENNLVGQIIKTKRTITLGSGLMFYRVRYEGEKEIKEFVDEPSWYKEMKDKMDMDDYLRKAAKNLFIHANVFTEFLRNGEGKIFSMECWESRHSRAGIQDNKGYINEYYWCGNWGQRNKREKFPVMMTPAYNKSDFKNYELKGGVYVEAKKPAQSKFLYHVVDDLLTDDYYGIPVWWGGRKWVEAANRIPIFHNSNLENGYFLRMQIEIPKDYFTDFRAMSMAKSEEEQKTVADRESQARLEFINKVNQFLSAANNAGRAIFTEYEINKQLGKEFPGIKFTNIGINPLDDAMLNLFDRSNDAVTSGQGIFPSLAGIQKDGKMGSGSDIRNSNGVFIATQTPEPRALLLKPYYLARRINAPANEQDIMMGFRDIEVTNLDENKSGMQESVQTPAEA